MSAVAGLLRYQIDVRRPVHRMVRVELEFSRGDLLPPGGGQVDLFLPTWTPGSYLVREFSRHLSRVAAVDAASGKEIPCRKSAKNRFQLELGAEVQRVRVSYHVYAHELSVRTADLTADHAFWNHACLLLWPAAGMHLAAQLEVCHPSTWDLACALPRDREVIHDAIEGTCVTTLRAVDLHQVFDSPCLVAAFQRVSFTVRGVPIVAAIDGLAPVALPPTFVADLTAIFERAADLFDGRLPFGHYTILCLFSADGYGGLEHAESTTLLFGRAAFATAKGYREFLSLLAHELFHAWNGKRLRPVEYWRYDYERENYTEFLWLIEGWTAYYDDLLCLRAGVMTRADYLVAVAKNVNGMLGAPGRLRLSLGESSFDAWIRLYRPDENTRNSSQNYYGNGAVAAMCMDLAIRESTQGARSLDDVVRALLRQTFAAGRGYTRADVHAVLLEAGGQEAVTLLASLVDQRLDPALSPRLASFGLRVVERDAEKPFFGVQFDGGSTVVASVIAGSPAHEAGVHPGDEILALDGLRVDAARWSDVFTAVAKIAAKLEVLYSRRGVVGKLAVIPKGSPSAVSIEPEAVPTPAAKALLDGWLPVPAVAPAPAAVAGATKG